MLSNLKETDEDVPHRHGDYYYFSRTVQGKPYRISCRTALGSTVEEVILDENKVAEGFDYCEVGGIDPCPAHRYLAYTVDNDGGETYVLRVKDLQTGEMLQDEISDTSGDFSWGADSSTLYYTKMDEEHRPNRLYMHVMGTPETQDLLLLTENDSMFWMSVDKSASDKLLFVSVESKETSEVSFIDLEGVVGAEGHKQASTLQMVQSRRFGLRYDVEHHGEHLYIVSNDRAQNNKLSRALLSTPSIEHWTDVRPYDDSIQIDDFLPFKDYFAIFGRSAGLQACWVVSAAFPSTWSRVSFAEEVFGVSSGANCVYDSPLLRLGYTSLVTPAQVIDYDMRSGERVVLKEREVPGYVRENYVCSRIEATAADGTKVPMSIVRHKNASPADRPQPLLLYGYGSYGACMDPYFDYKRISLLDRGVTYVIAHIRGGGEMGKAWYEDHGKYLTKLNTFTDFADCAKHLIDAKYTSAEQLAIVGRSAGGLLIGATVNMFPSLFKCAVADVPFVDVLNTMSDPSIPLTVTEWEEWGNPNESKFYDYIASYSPYDNVSAQKYPAMLVTAGLNDPRVAYWEAAKWVARLRALKTDSNPLLLKTDLTSGHFSASDRYKLLRETAFEYAFIVDQIGASKRI